MKGLRRPSYLRGKRYGLESDNLQLDQSFFCRFVDRRLDRARYPIDNIYNKYSTTRMPS